MLRRPFLYVFSGPLLAFLLHCHPQAPVRLNETASAEPGPAVGTRGMVSSAHPLATQAGLDVLAGGGNAFDAAVAVAAVLNVVEPEMSGIGGYGTILLYDAKTRQPARCQGRLHSRKPPRLGGHARTVREPAAAGAPCPGHPQGRGGVPAE